VICPQTYYFTVATADEKELFDYDICKFKKKEIVNYKGRQSKLFFKSVIPICTYKTKNKVPSARLKCLYYLLLQHVLTATYLQAKNYFTTRTRVVHNCPDINYYNILKYIWLFS